MADGRGLGRVRGVATDGPPSARRASPRSGTAPRDGAAPPRLRRASNEHAAGRPFMSPDQGSRIRLSAILVVLAGLNLGGGFLMHGYVLARLGAGVETDALFAGMALPQVVLAIIASSFMHVVVPLLAGSEDHQFRRDAWAFADDHAGRVRLDRGRAGGVRAAVDAAGRAGPPRPGPAAPDRDRADPADRDGVHVAGGRALGRASRPAPLHLGGVGAARRHHPRVGIPDRHAAAVGRPRRRVGPGAPGRRPCRPARPGPRPLPGLRGQPGDGGPGVAPAAAADARHGVQAGSSRSPIARCRRSPPRATCRSTTCASRWARPRCRSRTTR